jgi:esterase/lipase superfamily enzyme
MPVPSLPLHQKHFHLFFHDFNSTFEASSRAETTIASLAKIPSHNAFALYSQK